MLSSLLLFLSSTGTALTVERVQFNSNGIPVVGNLFLPDNVDRTGGNASLSAIAVGHPWTGVKEQTSGLYARQLAENGFITLAFDAAYQGESGGFPRWMEDPYQRAEDVKSAVSYLSTLAIVDPDRIGALGICASGGYVPYAAQTESRIKAVATVSAFDVGQYVREPWGGGEVNYTALAGTIATGGRLRTQEMETGSVQLAYGIPMSPAQVTPSTPRMLAEAYEYYRTDRAMHPRSPNVYVSRSTELMATYDSFAEMALIAPRPLLMIYGSRAETAYFTERGFQNAAEPKELFVVPNRTHVDLYDHTDVTVPRIVQFMRQNL
ncbi:Alpha/Beta hydrolase protein [Aspergillus venezuelensis]